MQASDIPLKLPKAFADAASGTYKRTIPVPSQIGITDGAASLTDGFPPLTATPVGAGGIPPDIKDMNGILYEISAWAKWVAAGSSMYFDDTFSTAIGGYPRGAILASVTTAGLVYVCTADNNTTNPDFRISPGVIPAGWLQVGPQQASPAQVAAGTADGVYVAPSGLASVPRIVQGVYGPNGYRRWSDGLVEQWGRNIGSYGSEIAVPVNFNYTGWAFVDNISISTAISGSPAYWLRDAWTQLIRDSISTTGFSFQCQHTSSPVFNPINGVDWIARGRDF